MDVSPPKIRFDAILKLLAARMLLSSDVYSEEFNLYIVLIIVILKNRSTPATETLQFSISLYKPFLIFLTDTNTIERQSIENFTAKLQGTACGISMIIFYIQVNIDFSCLLCAPAERN